MFKLNEKDAIKRNILKSDYIRCSPSDLSTITTPISQTYINLPREDSVNTVLGSYLQSNFDVLHPATGNRYADGNDIKLAKLGLLGVFSNYKSTTSSGKILEEISYAHIASLMYKLITGAKDSDDLSIGFDRDRGRRQEELTNNTNQKGKNRAGIYIKDIFGSAETCGKATYGLSYTINVTRNTDKAVSNKDIANNIGKNKITSIEWFVPHIISSFSQPAIITNPILSETPTGTSICSEICFHERSIYSNVLDF